jgi:hypothetical protein
MQTTDKKQIQMESRQGNCCQLNNLMEDQPVQIPDI